jgi:acyl carrier protein
LRSGNTERCLEPAACHPLSGTTLAEVVAAHRIDLLKIDVEKAEADVLAGIDPATWEKIDQVVLEVHDLPGRLELTLYHNVCARRPGARPPVLVESRPAQTRAALTAELCAFVTRPLADLPLLDEVVWVAQIEAANAPAEMRAATLTGRASAVLSGAWTALFGAGSDTPEADFFDLGGDSLTAVRLLAKIENQLGEEIVEPDLIFTTTRFGDLADALASALRSRDGAGGGNDSG